MAGVPLRWLAVLIVAFGGAPARADTETGLADFRDGRVAEAVLEWRRGAAGGDPAAALFLGVAFDTGQGVAADPRAAMAWYRRAAEGGSPTGMFNLAVLFDSGQAGVQDIQAAIHWYGMAAQAGFARADYNLGLIFEAGAGVPRDPAKARGYFAAASRAGITEAARHLGRPPARRQASAAVPAANAELDGFALAQTLLLRGGPGQAAGAVAALRRSAGTNPLAAYDLGYLLENGIGGPVDRPQALRLYQQAAKAAADPALQAMAAAGAQSVQQKLQPGTRQAAVPP